VLCFGIDLLNFLNDKRAGLLYDIRESQRELIITLDELIVKKQAKLFGMEDFVECIGINDGVIKISIKISG